MDKSLLDFLFDIDLKNGKFYWKNVSKYHKNLNGKEAGAERSCKNGKKYWVIKINNKAYKRARLIFLFLNGRFPFPCVDHIDGNSLNDNPENLREATVTQNSWNHKGRKKTTNLPMGIRKVKDRYVSRISVNKKHIHIGTFVNLNEALESYKNARIKYYGEFNGYITGK